MWNCRARRLSTGAFAFVYAILPLPVVAQPAPATKVRPMDATPVCMQGKWRAIEQVSAERRGKPIDLVVARTDVTALQASGFVVVDCNASGLDRAERRAAWRDQICALAAYGNEAVQNQLAAALGARPANLCGSAELVAGPWRRPTK